MKLLESDVSMVKELIEKGELDKDSPNIEECKNNLIDKYYEILDGKLDKTTIALEVDKYFADELGFEV